MNRTAQMELLSPAGNEEALRAAVDSGANAVYLGYQSFGARASAANFNDEALQKAIDYAHLYHVRVHVTVNTLIKPDEIDRVHQALSVIEACHADAVIIQDMAVAAMVRKDFPRLQMHASTQMAICNAIQARYAAAQGFQRVVLARECNLDAVKSIAAAGIETEVFAHGALCTAVSGRCLMSSLAGGRSGNRGRCAQPCRQSYAYNGIEAPWLSLRDLCVLEHLPALQAAGVASIKIEGRLKSPEYVAVVTGIYRKALDDLQNNTFSSHRPEDMQALKQIFNRGHFTKGHLLNAEDSDLVSGTNVSHEGIVIGKVVSTDSRFASLLLTEPLSNGDSLQLRGRKICETRYSGPDMPRGSIAMLRLREDMPAEKGMFVARLASSLQLEQARNHQPPEIPVQMHFYCEAQKPMQLTVTDGNVSVSMTGPVASPAQKRASTAEDIVRQLMKLGDTPFVTASHSVAVETDSQCFLPVSVLNQLRRDALMQLQEERIAAFYRQDKKPRGASTPFMRKQCNLASPGLAVLFREAALKDRLQNAGAALLIYDAPSFGKDYLLQNVPSGVWLRIPPQLSGTDAERLPDILQALAPRLQGLWVESIGWLHLSTDLPIIAGEGVPVCSSLSAKQMACEGISGFCAWPEWNRQELSQIDACGLPVFLKVYGRESLMLLNHCPKRVAMQLRQGHADCRLCRSEQEVCAQAHASLTDHRGHCFPLIRTRFSRGCEITVLNPLPTDLSAYLPLNDFPSAYPLLRFTNESNEEAVSITNAFAQLQKAAPQSTSPLSFPSTSGHWLRGVE